MCSLRGIGPAGATPVPTILAATRSRAHSLVKPYESSYLPRDASLVTQQPKQEMFGVDMVTVELACLILGERNDLACGTREALVIVMPCGDLGQHPLAQLLRLYAEVTYETDRGPVILSEQREQHMRGLHPLAVKPLSLRLRALDDSLRLTVVFDALRTVASGAARRAQLLANALGTDPKHGQHMRRKTLMLPEQSKQNVLRTDTVMTQRAGLITSRKEDGVLGASSEAHLVARRPRRLVERIL